MDDDEQYRVPQFLQEALRNTVHTLVIGDYEGLARDGRAGKLSPAQLQHAIEEYGRTLIDLPDEAFEPDNAHAYLREGQGQQWGVDLAMWTREEGRSDLTLQLLVEATNKGIGVQIEDLHVM